MQAAQQTFKTAYGIARKHAAGLIEDSTADYGLDDEALAQRTASLVARKLGIPRDMRMPQVTYQASVAAAGILSERHYAKIPKRTLQQRLSSYKLRNNWDEADDDYIDD